MMHSGQSKFRASDTFRLLNDVIRVSSAAGTKITVRPSVIRVLVRIVPVLLLEFELGFFRFFDVLAGVQPSSSMSDISMSLGGIITRRWDVVAP